MEIIEERECILKMPLDELSLILEGLRKLDGTDTVNTMIDQIKKQYVDD